MCLLLRAPPHNGLDLSSGLDFETNLLQKRALSIYCTLNWRVQNIRSRRFTIETNTDPYQAIEGRYQTTRQILELMLETRHPVAIVTKGP